MTNNNVLLVLTSHNDLAGLRKTGFYVGEAAYPWKVFNDAGWQVDLASIRGGEPPRDGENPDDPVQREFLNDPDIARKLANTPSLDDVDSTRYEAVLYVGGHGAVFDFPKDPSVCRVGRQVWERGGVVAAVCHGPAALLDLTLSDGSYLVAGRRVAGFTNDEEHANGTAEVVPYLLADELVARGATHVPGANFTTNVVVDGRLVTGQNPQSAAEVARQVVAVASGE